MMISQVHGQFEKVEGRVEFDPQRPAETIVDVRLEAASISTREPQRDAHLKSADFLDADNYPYLTFTGRRVEVIDATHARLVGDLTIRDVTREATLAVEYNGMAKSPWGTTSAGFTASTAINRKDWNLTWNVALETGGWLVGETINIYIEMEIVRQPASVAEIAA
jgi:polyisoprenoid-binding protein YceI